MQPGRPLCGPKQRITPATAPTGYIKLRKDLESLIPVTFAPSTRPKAFALWRHSNDGLGQGQNQDDQVGWFLPDSEDDMPAELLCPRLRVEPESEEGKHNFVLPFVVCDIALVLVPVRAPASGGAVPAVTTAAGGEGSVGEVFRRLGYFELRRRKVEVRYTDLTFSGPVSLTKVTLPAR
jgi:hypothetical protein